MSALTRTKATALAASLLLLPACGHKGDPRPPLRRTPPGLTEFRFAQRGDALEVSALAPAGSVDGIAYEQVAIEILYAEGDKDIERAGQRRERLAYPRQRITETLALPASGTTARAAARALYRGEKGPRTLTLALVVQDVVKPPAELRARLEGGGVALAWSGDVPAPVDAAVKLPRAAVPFQSPASGPPSASGPPAAGAQAGPAAAGPASKPPGAAAPPQPGAAASPAPQDGPPKPAAAPATPAGPPGSATAAASGAAVATVRSSGFHLYRRVGTEPYGVPLSPVPLGERHARDLEAPMGATVCYVVRAVASAEPLVESAASNEACVDVRDVDAPLAPGGLAVLPREGGLEVLWSPSPEADLASYRVYRQSPGEALAKVAEVPAGRASWLDASARAGVSYSYWVSAVDATGNESPHGGPAEGSLP
jgi:hypothetical protein